MVGGTVLSALALLGAFLYSVTAVGAGPATQLDLAFVDTTVTVGVASNFEVQALDAGGVRDTGYLGTVTFTASCGDCFTVTPNNGGANSKSYTYGAGDAGVKGFTIVWTQVGTHSLTVTGTLPGGGTDSDNVSNVNVTSTDATEIDLRFVDTNVTVGVPSTFEVQALNAQNARAEGYLGTVTFTASCGDCFTVTPNNGGAGIKSYTYGVGDAGLKGFTIVWTQVGTHSLTVSGTLPGGGTDTDNVSNVNVTSADATEIDLRFVDTSVTAGVPSTFEVQALNAQGGRAEGYLGTVTFTASCGDGCFTITPNNGGATAKSYTYGVGDAGLKTFTIVWNQPGTHSLTVSGTLPGGGTDTDNVSNVDVTGTATSTTMGATTTTLVPTTSTTVGPTTSTTAGPTTSTTGGPTTSTTGGPTTSTTVGPTTTVLPTTTVVQGSTTTVVQPTTTTLAQTTTTSTLILTVPPTAPPTTTQSASGVSVCNAGSGGTGGSGLGAGGTAVAGGGVGAGSTGGAATGGAGTGTGGSAGSGGDACNRFGGSGAVPISGAPTGATPLRACNAGNGGNGGVGVGVGGAAVAGPGAVAGQGGTSTGGAGTGTGGAGGSGGDACNAPVLVSSASQGTSANRLVPYLAILLFALFLRTSSGLKAQDHTRPVLVHAPFPRPTSTERTRAHPALDHPALDALIDTEHRIE